MHTNARLKYCEHTRETSCGGGLQLENGGGAAMGNLLEMHLEDQIDTLHWKVEVLVYMQSIVSWCVNTVYFMLIKNQQLSWVPSKGIQGIVV